MADRTVVMNDGEQERPHANITRPAPKDIPKCPLCKIDLRPSTQASFQSQGRYYCPTCGYVYDSSIDLKPGTEIVGKYRILKTLGSGGFGDIYLCHPINDLKTRYVLKVLRDVTTPESQKRFEREARLLKMMTPPVIVKFIDYWMAYSGAYIVMEYVDGVNLNDIFKHYDIDEGATLQIALEIAKALKFCWDIGKIVHRDIKPSNIMINNNMEVKLLDFGMAKQTNHETADITASNAGIGTPKYMSPEQYRNAKSVDFRSDIYSLGVTMYFLLKRETPFSGNNFIEIYKDTVKNSPPSRMAFNGICSNECASLIQHMMQLYPDKRPESYDVLIDEIKSVLNKLEGN
ncbi:MAG: serine/threonine protein kinase [Victivallales bacterium]|nr:serine/threonine protein kinase [Victivallales bacterium]